MRQQLSVVFGWSRVAIVLKLFCVLPSSPFPGPLARESRIFIVCTHWHFQVAGFSSPSPGYMRQKENPRNSPLPHSLGPKSLADLSSFHFQSLLIFVLHTMCRSFLFFVHSKRNKEKVICSIFQEADHTYSCSSLYPPHQSQFLA